MSEKTIEVKIDRSLIEARLQEEKEAERLKAEQAQKELAELKNKVFQDKKKALGCNDETIINEDSLIGWQTAKQAEQQKHQKPATGSAPINPSYHQNQQSNSKEEQGFDNYADMVQYLRKESKQGNQTATEQLNALFARANKSIDEPMSLSGSLKDFLNNKPVEWKKKSPSSVDIENQELLSK